MRIIHITRRRLGLSALGLAAVAALAVVLAGCFARKPAQPEGAVTAPTDADRTAYLESLGWQVDAAPLETLDLQLPKDLSQGWSDYAALQTAQGLPFAGHGGHTVRRYTYTVTNYPGITKGVQANLYLWGDEIIGGDIIATGPNGFQTGLAFPGENA